MITSNKAKCVAYQQYLRESRHVYAHLTYSTLYSHLYQRVNWSNNFCLYSDTEWSHTFSELKIHYIYKHQLKYKAYLFLFQIFFVLVSPFS